ncbi:acetyl-CoA C-acyltransferase [Lujinxingia litoralis]|uniref:Acetyl-CoA C-acyltransferase n=1 Tax=Lujinxingia litoralis TaxID=2211119 RepID=A0A328C5L5_9DELT|nr:acetyl-CoA C-acyltransferase [Lujinxingia litoralis]RAL22306.1 acetyl-CoA C-acyltransferase [Lujinxingia litoralis]
MANPSSNSSSTLGGNDRVAIIAGVRTPFARAWTAFKHWTEADLGRTVANELLNRVDIDPELIDELIFGCVSAPMDGPNVGREVVLRSQLPRRIPASTVQMYCASSAYAAVQGVNALLLNTADVVMVGGVESMSSARARFSLGLSHALQDVAKARNLQDRLKALSQIKAGDLLPEQPAIEEPTTGKSMGESAEDMAKHYGISRREQDEYAERTHHLAAAGYEEGFFPEVMSVLTGDAFDQVLERDNNVRADTSVERMARLRPVFDRQHGTVTAANASPLTDGASAVLLMRESRARKLGLTPLAFVRSYAQVGIDIQRHNLLLGPTLATPIAFERAGVSLDDMDLVEMHEAFAAQVLANLKIWKSPHLCQELGLDEAIGEVNMETFNVHGGSVALGHPFGATGTRIITQLAQEMARRDVNLGLLTMCAAGGLGLSMVLER